MDKYERYVGTGFYNIYAVAGGESFSYFVFTFDISNINYYI